jgi:type I site-specific restriction endonuclease
MNDHSRLVKSAWPTVPDNFYESERQTRRQRIDPKLRAAGWTIVPFDQHGEISTYRKHAIEEYPTANGPADYALVVDGELVGVMEAKKVTLGPQNVLVQAERYSRGLANGRFNIRGMHTPFLLSTNGEVIHFHDIRHERSLSRKIAKLPTPAALSELLTPARRASSPSATPPAAPAASSSRPTNGSWIRRKTAHPNAPSPAGSNPKPTSAKILAKPRAASPL